MLAAPPSNRWSQSATCCAVPEHESWILASPVAHDELQPAMFQPAAVVMSESVDGEASCYRLNAVSVYPAPRSHDHSQLRRLTISIADQAVVTPSPDSYEQALFVQALLQSFAARARPMKAGVKASVLNMLKLRVEVVVEKRMDSRKVYEHSSYGVVNERKGA